MGMTQVRRSRKIDIGDCSEFALSDRGSDGRKQQVIETKAQECPVVMVSLGLSTARRECQRVVQLKPGLSSRRISPQRPRWSRESPFPEQTRLNHSLVHASYLRLRSSPCFDLSLQSCCVRIDAILLYTSESSLQAMQSPFRLSTRERPMFQTPAATPFNPTMSPCDFLHSSINPA